MASRRQVSGGFSLHVSHASFSVVMQKRRKRILDNVSFEARSGELLVVMGPSGSGKTTLLELLALEFRGGEARGNVTLNGHPLTAQVLRQRAVYVEQEGGMYWSCLTCRETMRFAAELCLPGRPKLQNQRVDSIMQRLGLLECADTRVGNQLYKGMSGGQKKRLSLGVALLKDPQLLLIDEPTTGLDAAAAASVAGYLVNVARAEGLVAMATIHQPSTEVFLSFANVMILANGRVAYSGPSHGLASYCQGIGQQVPRHTNPADHYLQLVNSEFTGRESADSIVATWRSRCPDMDQAPAPGRFPTDVARPNPCLQCLALLRRHGLLSIRDPTLYVGRMVAFVASNCFLAVLYIKTRERRQENVLAQVYMRGWFMALPSIFSVVVVPVFNSEFTLVLRETRNGLFSIGPYLLANFLLQLPYMMVMAVFALVVPHFMSGGNNSGLPGSLCIMAVMLWCFECMAQAIGVSFRSAPVGMLAMLGLWFCIFLFMGTFVQEKDIIWPLSILCRILPLMWAGRALSYLEFHNTEYEGAVAIPPEVASASVGIAPAGVHFFCPGLPLTQCYGRTGTEVMKSLSVAFSNVRPRDDVLLCACRMLAIAVVFKAIHVSAAVLRSVLGSTLKPGTVFMEGDGILEYEEADEDEGHSSESSSCGSDWEKASR